MWIGYLKLKHYYIFKQQIIFEAESFFANAMSKYICKSDLISDKFIMNCLTRTGFWHPCPPSPPILGLHLQLLIREHTSPFPRSLNRNNHKIIKHFSLFLPFRFFSSILFSLRLSTVRSLSSRVLFTFLPLKRSLD